MRGNLKGKIFIGIGVVMLITALVLVTYNCVVSERAGENAQSVVAQLDGDIPDDASTDYDIDADAEMPLVTVDGNDYIGELIVESLGIKLPVMSSWSYEKLNIAPCRYSGSIYKSNMVIAGHNYDSHLGKLRNISIGDSVTFIDVDGNKFLYEVKDLEIMPPTDVEKMVDSDWDLTLFTCTIGAKTRLAFRCALQSVNGSPAEVYGL
jgi:sortase A